MKDAVYAAPLSLRRLVRHFFAMIVHAINWWLEQNGMYAVIYFPYLCTLAWVWWIDGRKSK